MQRKFNVMMVLLLAMSLVFCFGAMAWADDEGALTNPAEETELTEDELAAISEEAGEEEVAEEEVAEEEVVEEEVAEGTVFSDVPADHWAADYIADILAREITKGTSETTFSPDATLTRAQFVTFLGRLAGIDDKEYATQESAFTDIEGLDWAYGYICWAAEVGITQGVTPIIFNPNGELTREQMATMVLRFTKAYNIDMTVEEYPVMTDAGEISTFAEEGVNALAGTYISLIDGEFLPQGNATRAQMAQVISLLPVPENGYAVGLSE